MVRVRVCGCACVGGMGVCACVMPLICCMELANRLRCSSFCQALKRVASVGSFSISLFSPLCLFLAALSCVWSVVNVHNTVIAL